MAGVQIEDKDVVIGFIRIFDLGEDIFDDETPLFDIRIKKDFIDLILEKINW